MTEMRYLTLAENNITDISSLVGMSNLRHLTLNSNPNLKDFNTLKDLASLEYLDLRETKISGTQFDKIKKQLGECNILIQHKVVKT